ncbi:DASH complex subunit dam1 [Schizosaccharomyces pombe]|uniref:DASH complex subunit dam1 n=1 Tax=Schizosaccharomyces pombe (strain 972 / ATCC 24843) TaxID=284812 RepID=DAM1_SCHPO|nr:DASH complex subunit Dam1 [Schizosaccharomyces pombe]Q9HDZ6.1 RecName: Full=DASH complex subunit dam1; AltName: Full=Outer kinetochore protein dam1 [Schizosaccharomyces pombe 972h-]CAC19765.1 DASH complex subunit Dam1 [Schizosaccharomyces pombe]|eukprot:NP_594056.1 DASH complex subunit Dam1 [Schizosaccharomyces pombe]
MEKYQKATQNPLENVDNVKIESENAIPSNLQAFTKSLAVLDDNVSEFRKRMNHLSATKQILDNFNESFSSFLYGLQINAFCVDYENAPLSESFLLQAKKDQFKATLMTRTGHSISDPPYDGGVISHDPNFATADETFATNDTSFIERPETYSASR